MPLLRHPAFAVGVVLLVLGFGNWMVARARLAEYTDALDGHEPVATLGNFEEFSELDARTNAELLRPLHRGVNDEAVTDAKIDFYKVVRSGGALFAFAGLGMILGASVAVGRRRDLSLASRPH
ncbi:MAG TPA: hypothetical protein VL403_00715 [Candidatus Kryptonia bacterium]|nr:hypothetical protein [Candidatus Kryptonia bacterium]